MHGSNVLERVIVGMYSHSMCYWIYPPCLKMKIDMLSDFQWLPFGNVGVIGGFLQRRAWMVTAYSSVALSKHGTWRGGGRREGCANCGAERLCVMWMLWGTLSRRRRRGEEWAREEIGSPSLRSWLLRQPDWVSVYPCGIHFPISVALHSQTYAKSRTTSHWLCRWRKCFSWSIQMLLLVALGGRNNRLGKSRWYISTVDTVWLIKIEESVLLLQPLQRLQSHTTNFDWSWTTLITPK